MDENMKHDSMGNGGVTRLMTIMHHNNGGNDENKMSMDDMKMSEDDRRQMLHHHHLQTQWVDWTIILLGGEYG